MSQNWNPDGSTSRYENNWRIHIKGQKEKNELKNLRLDSSYYKTYEK